MSEKPNSNPSKENNGSNDLGESGTARLPDLEYDESRRGSKGVPSEPAPEKGLLDTAKDASSGNYGSSIDKISNKAGSIGKNAQRASQMGTPAAHIPGNEETQASLGEKVDSAQTVARAAGGDASALTKAALDPEKHLGNIAGVSKENQERIKEVRKVANKLSWAWQALANPLSLVLAFALIVTLIWVTNFKTIDDTVGRNPNACKVASDCSVNQSSAVNNAAISGGDVVSLARQAAWPAGTPASKYTLSGKNCTEANSNQRSKPEYVAARQLAIKNNPSGKESFCGADQLYASCDRFAATIMRATKTDINFPWGNVDTQLAYMRSNDKWKKRPGGKPKPGDIMILAGSHIMIALDKNQVAEASYGFSNPSKTARISPMYGIGQYEVFYRVG